MIVERARGSSDELRALFDEALAGLVHKRGGRAFLETLGVDEHSFEQLLANECLWVASEDVLVGFGVCRNGLIMGLYVKAAQRRQGVARAIVSEIIRACAPNDAYALPGDRAMKSLYESFGWKARLLTMRAD